jgi:uncharacterized protein (DUF433 family)
MRATVSDTMPYYQTWIDINAEIMGGKPCVRDTRVTVDTIVCLTEIGYTQVDLLEAYPYLTEEDLIVALAYARDTEQGAIPP